MEFRDMKIRPQSEVLTRPDQNHPAIAQCSHLDNTTPLVLLMCLTIAALLLTPLSIRGADPIAMGVVEAVGMGTVDRTRFKNRGQAKIMARRAATA